jgi:tetratricopeptide (TPR) repeat protein
MTEDTWDEHWLPLHRTRGFSATQSDLILSVGKDDKAGPFLRLAALRPFGKLFVRAWNGKRRLGPWQVARLTPGRMFVQSLSAAGCDRVQVTDARGAVLLDWTEYAFDKKDWQKQGFEDPLPGPETQDKLFAQAEKARFLYWPRPSQYATETYAKILAADAGHVGARRALAEIAFFQGDYGKAVEHLRAALPRAPLQADLHALLGWAHLRRNELDAAQDAFGCASRNEPGRRRGLFGLGWVHLRAGRIPQAADTAAKLLSWNPADKWGRLLLAMACRKAGRTSEAADIVRQLQSEDPIWAPVSAEALLLQLPSVLAGGTRRLADDAAYAATPYLELGWWDDAIALLRHDETNEPFSPAVRLAHLLFAQESKGDRRGARAALAALRRAPVEQAHAWTTVALDLLRKLTAGHPREPVLQILLGNALAGRGFDAAPAFRRAAVLGFRHPVLSANLGAIEAKHKNRAAARRHYLAALRAAPGDVSLFLEADRFLASIGAQRDRAALYQALPPRIRTRPMIAQRRVTQLLDAEKYREALAFIDGHTFFRGEWEASLRTAYLESVLANAVPLILRRDYPSALALLRRGLEYPRNQSIGRKPDAPNEAFINFWLGTVSAMAGKPEDARRYWTAAVTEPLFAGGLCEIYAMFAANALGDTIGAQRLAADIEATTRGTRPAHMYFHYFNGGDFAFHTGMLQLFRGRPAEARRTWKEGLRQRPHLRFLRLHLHHMPVALLRRMANPVAN